MNKFRLGHIDYKMVNSTNDPDYKGIVFIILFYNEIYAHIFVAVIVLYHLLISKCR